MRKIFRVKYPKLILLLLSIILAYVLFKNQEINRIIINLNELSYLGVFLAGFLFSFGFTTPFAIGFFISLNPENIILSAFLGGVGALIGDLIIYKIIKFSFIDEFNRLKNTKEIRKIRENITKNISKKIRLYIAYIFLGIVIASPLPDELGVTMLAGLSHIKIIPLAIFSLMLHSIGILFFFFL